MREMFLVEPLWFEAVMKAVPDLEEEIDRRETV
jgi:hypothetical protein